MKKNNIHRSASLLLSAALVCGTMAACSTGNTTGSASSGAASTGSAASALPGTVTYPLKTDVTLTYWGINMFPANVTKQEDVPFLQELEKRTGVKVQYTMVAGSADDQNQKFNLMVSSGSLPDIIDEAQKFSGGAASGVKNGYILPLNDMLAKDAPDYLKYLQDHPVVDKMVKTDNGVYCTFPLVRGDDELTTFNGLFLRKDWLDDLGLAVPTTIDEWHTVLTAFKDKKGAEAPMLLDATNDWYMASLTGAFGMHYGYYQDNGTVKYGPAQPAFKDFLKTMQQWYAEGLIDKNYATSDSKARDAAMTTGKSGAMFAAVGGGIGKYLAAVQSSDPKFDLVAAPYPTLKTGEKPKFGYKADYSSVSGAAISSTCKNPDIAAKFLNYGYTEEGHTFFNFGTEGVSYTMVNGQPTYTDLILKNPDGLSASQAMSYYAGASNRGAGMVQDLGYYHQYLSLPQQQNALKVWANTDAIKNNLPPVTPTEEQVDESGKLSTAIKTYVSENVAKFIMGSQSIDQFDTYISGFSKLNLDRLTQIQQEALDRYNKK